MFPKDNLTVSIYPRISLLPFQTPLAQGEGLKRNVECNQCLTIVMPLYKHTHTHILAHSHTHWPKWTLLGFCCIEFYTVNPLEARGTEGVGGINVL